MAYYFYAIANRGIAAPQCGIPHLCHHPTVCAALGCGDPNPLHRLINKGGDAFANTLCSVRGYAETGFPHSNTPTETGFPHSSTPADTARCVPT